MYGCKEVFNNYKGKSMKVKLNIATVWQFWFNLGFLKRNETDILNMDTTIEITTLTFRVMVTSCDYKYCLKAVITFALYSSHFPPCRNKRSKQEKNNDLLLLFCCSCTLCGCSPTEWLFTEARRLNAFFSFFFLQHPGIYISKRSLPLNHGTCVWAEGLEARCENSIHLMMRLW